MNKPRSSKEQELSYVLLIELLAFVSPLTIYRGENFGLIVYC